MNSQLAALVVHPHARHESQEVRHVRDLLRTVQPDHGRSPLQRSGAAHLTRLTEQLDSCPALGKLNSCLSFLLLLLPLGLIKPMTDLDVLTEASVLPAHPAVLTPAALHCPVWT